MFRTRNKTIPDAHLDAHTAEPCNGQVSIHNGLSKSFVVLVFKVQVETTHLIAIIGVHIAKFCINRRLNTCSLFENELRRLSISRVSSKDKDCLDTILTSTRVPCESVINHFRAFIASFVIRARNSNIISLCSALNIVEYRGGWSGGG